MKEGSNLLFFYLNSWVIINNDFGLRHSSDNISFVYYRVWTFSIKALNRITFFYSWGVEPNNEFTLITIVGKVRLVRSSGQTIVYS